MQLLSNQNYKQFNRGFSSISLKSAMRAITSDLHCNATNSRVDVPEPSVVFIIHIACSVLHLDVDLGFKILNPHTSSNYTRQMSRAPLSRIALTNNLAIIIYWYTPPNAPPPWTSIRTHYINYRVMVAKYGSEDLASCIHCIDLNTYLSSCKLTARKPILLWI